MECDGLIVSAPIISRTVTGRLKLLGDRLLGPNADVAIVARAARGARRREPAMPFRVDERVLKPRVAGFIAVGGSLTPQWKTLALPVLHTMTFSMQTAVVDQVVVRGRRDAALDRARRRGARARRAARAQRRRRSSGGRSRTSSTAATPGLCPMCHLDVSCCAGARSSARPAARAATLDGRGVRFRRLTRR